MPYALVVEDDAHFATVLSELIQADGYQVGTVGTIQGARAQLEFVIPDVALIDLMLPDGSGIELIHEITLLAPETRVLVITGHAAVESTVAALRAGVADFLTKPLDIEQLHVQLQKIKQELDDQAISPEQTPKTRDRFGPLIGVSGAMNEIYNLVEKVASTDLTVLLYGESGTGKELVAKAIHDHSARREQPFLAINCGAVSHNLIANELFGHERGSFTDANTQHRGYFERAQYGTLFLDEITEMPLDLQVQLLRVLENRTITRVGGMEEISVDVRIVAATNYNLREAVAEGRLREDLLFRLMVFPVNLPPLRKRFDDIPLLAEHFLKCLNESHSTNKHFAPAAVKLMKQYYWPGNVRELQNAIQHAFILASDIIDSSHFPQGLGTLTPQDDALLHCPPGTPIEDFERRFILATLEHHSGNKRLAAETLGISLKTLYNRINQYNSQD